MSLIHWWPLNGNTKDYGIRNITLTNSGATINNNGKIGKTYEFDGSSSYLEANLSSEVFAGTNHPFSIAFWLKFTDDISSRKIIFGNYGLSNSFFNIEMSYGSSSYNGKLRFDWLSSIDHWFPATGVQNVWQHYVVTFDGINKISMYFNGSLIESFTGTLASVTGTRFFLGRDSRTGDTALKGFLNDFRIYNHCLSLKEVKEISKGLVLHYTFEDAYAEGTTNLASYDWVTYWNNSGDSSRNFNDTSLFSPVNSKIMSQTQTTAGQSAFGLGLSSIALPSQTITVSVWFFKKGTASNNSYGPFVRDGDTDEWLGMFSYNGSDNYRDWPSGTWLFLTQTITTGSGAGRPYICCYTGGQDEYFAFTGWQIEQKNHSTPYVNGTRPNGLIYDNSGYGYNGTIVGDCQIIPESKSGNYSLFNNSTNIGTSTSTGAAYVKGDLKNSYTPNEITISFWANVLDYNYQNSGILSLSNNGDYPVDYYDNGVHQYDSGFRFNLSITPNVLSSTSLIVLNEWHLYTLTYDGSSLKSYRDGNLIETVSGTGYINAFKYIYLGLNVAGGAWRQSKEYWGDFKIYATALSAEDILLEYNRKASIDKTGKLFAPYIEEYETTNNLLSYVNYRIESQDSIRWYLSVVTKDNYEAHKNDSDYAYNYSLGAYTQANLSVTMTSQGIRIYSEPNDPYSNFDQWGGICISPMAISDCLFKGHRYRLSWHASGKSSRAMNDVYFSSQIGWGTSATNPNTTSNKLITTPTNFQGEMDCFWDFTINDDIFKVCTDNGGNTSFTVGETYLSYAGLKMGFGYEDTGTLGTDIYITNLQLHDLTTGDVYKIGKNGVVKTIEVVSGRRDSARLHSDGVIDVTDIIEN